MAAHIRERILKGIKIGSFSILGVGDILIHISLNVTDNVFFFLVKSTCLCKWEKYDPYITLFLKNDEKHS